MHCIAESPSDKGNKRVKCSNKGMWIKEEFEAQSCGVLAFVEESRVGDYVNVFHRESDYSTFS